MRAFLAAAAAITAAAAWAGPAQAGEKAITLGVLNDMSSLYSDATGKGSLVAAQMAVEDFGGKVLNKPIVVLSADHQNKPDVGSNITNKWIDEDGVDAIVDVPTSSIALAVQEITKKKDRV
ncbi:MAG TPA: ABC transporter substrate-binding protein, partial [Stellaceae bacterium]|nr:ABC transporter substrate-binding protein [Stellaceae bacterium]